MILLISLALPIIFIIYLLNKPQKSTVPPGPSPLPLIGNLHQIATSPNPHLYLWKLSKKHGPIIHMKLGSTPLIIISSAKLAKEVLKTLDSKFCSRPKLLGQQKLSYNGADIAFAPYDDNWREMKKITTVHLFSAGKIHSFRQAREDEISRMIAKISSQQGAVDLSKMAVGLTSGLICRIAFGKRYEEESSEHRRFEKLLREARALMATFFVSDYFPRFSWVDSVTGSVGRLDRTFRNLDSFYEELINEHLDQEKEKEEDILDILIKIEKEKSSEPNWDSIKAILMDIFVGGTDSSTASIVWNMSLLMKAPKIMKEVQEEIRNLVGKKGRVDEDDLAKLPYLRAVVYETLRLYPPLPLLIPRETTQECTLQGYRIQPKTVVYVNAWAVARDPECWENPDEFVPKRFLNSSNIDVKGQDFGVVPFGSGRRICPGMLMGLANVELAVANLLFSFDWELPPRIQPQEISFELLPGLMMHKKNALLLVPKKYVV